MKLVFSFFIFSLFGCELKGPVVSLSGAISHTIYALGLSSKLLAVSTYHKIPGPVQLSGGGLLSPKSLIPYKKFPIFYDDHQNLKRLLQNYPHKKIMKSRGEAPLKVIEKTIKYLRPYTIGCEKKISELLIKSRKMSKVTWKGRPQILFYLGRLKKNHRRPPLLMVNDGLVLSLIERSLIKSYPSPLAYVSWAKRLRDEFLRKKTWEVGMDSSSKGGLFEVQWQVSRENNSDFVNFSSPSLLTPGLGQLYFLEALHRFGQKYDF